MPTYPALTHTCFHFKLYISILLFYNPFCWIFHFNFRFLSFYFSLYHHSQPSFCCFGYKKTIFFRSASFFLFKYVVNECYYPRVWFSLFGNWLRFWSLMVYIEPEKDETNSKQQRKSKTTICVISVFELSNRNGNRREQTQSKKDSFKIVHTYLSFQQQNSSFGCSFAIFYNFSFSLNSFWFGLRYHLSNSIFTLQLFSFTNFFLFVFYFSLLLCSPLLRLHSIQFIFLFISHTIYFSIRFKLHWEA